MCFIGYASPEISIYIVLYGFNFRNEPVFCKTLKCNKIFVLFLKMPLTRGATVNSPLIASERNSPPTHLNERRNLLAPLTEVNREKPWEFHGCHLGSSLPILGLLLQFSSIALHLHLLHLLSGRMSDRKG
jgi:hypothetical protein